MNRLATLVAAVVSLAVTSVSAQPNELGWGQDLNTGNLPFPQVQDNRALAPPIPHGQTGAAGFDVGNLRTEVETYRFYRALDPVAARRLESSGIMLNGLYGIRLDGGITPYFGVGLGAINISERTPGASAERWLPAYQFRSGLNYELSRALSGLLEYRWQEGGVPAFLLAGTSTKLEFKHKGVVIGLNYRLQ